MNMAIIVQLTLAEMVPIVLKDLTKPFANVLAIMKVPCANMNLTSVPKTHAKMAAHVTMAQAPISATAVQTPRAPIVRKFFYQTFHPTDMESPKKKSLLSLVPLVVCLLS